MEFQDIKDVLTLAAFRPEADNPQFVWPKRFPNQRSLIINVSRAQISWAVINKRGRIDDAGSGDGEFMDVAASMADEWRNLTDNSWIGVSLNTRFIITLEHNLSRKAGSEDTIRSNPKSILGTKYDRSKRYALHHNPETSASLLLGCDDSLIQTVEDSLRNHSLKPARISCGLFAMTSYLLNQINDDAALRSEDLIVITWVDGSLFVLRQKAGQWQDVRCRSGLPPKDSNAISQMVKPFLETADQNTRILFMGDEPDNLFASTYLPKLESYRVTDLTEQNQLWSVLSQDLIHETHPTTVPIPISNVMDFVIHDLKTERANTSGGLPGIYKLVPIGFYLTAVAGIGLGIFFYLSDRAYKSSETEWNEKTQSAQAIQNEIVQKQTRVSSEATAATQMADWLEGARPVQPISIAIARSLEGNASIAELNLERNPQIAAHLFMTLKVNGGGTRQIEGTVEALEALSYQAYSAQQVKGPEAIDFNATLIWNENN